MALSIPPFANPFRPGAGHRPPYLAGRKHEEGEFRKLLAQNVVLDNLVITGLRGVGKTVLAESFKPTAVHEGWLWVGTDMSESAVVTESILAERILTDLSVVTSNISTGTTHQLSFGFVSKENAGEITLGYNTLSSIYKNAPGLVSDKLKAVFSAVAPHVTRIGKRGLLFVYDEAQSLADRDDAKEYPLSVLLDIFQSVQRNGMPFILVLIGLPTLYQKLVDSRTYSERMFKTLTLKKLSVEASREAITKPISDAKCPVKFSDEAISLIIKYSGGYPYFIQFMCREVYDVWMQKLAEGQEPIVPMSEIVRKLDNDFFAHRWYKVTERYHELLHVIAQLDNSNDVFTIQDILRQSVRINETFGRSRVNQMLVTLMEHGIVYKDRHGKYMFAVPLFADFVRRIKETGIL
ncbi:MAG: hypothetical protein WAU78_14135 [Roseiarcus sp.]